MIIAWNMPAYGQCICSICTAVMLLMYIGWIADVFNPLEHSVKYFWSETTNDWLFFYRYINATFFFHLLITNLCLHRTHLRLLATLGSCKLFLWFVSWHTNLVLICDPIFIFTFIYYKVSLFTLNFNCNLDQLLELECK